MIATIHPYIKDVEEVAEILNTDTVHGLSSSEASQRISIHGENKFDTQGISLSSNPSCIDNLFHRGHNMATAACLSSVQLS